MNRREQGFTIVEVLIAIVILAVGMLALATTAIFSTAQVRVADLKTEQSLAATEVIEQMRAAPFATLVDRDEGSAEPVGAFEAWWDITPINQHLNRVDIYLRGPGYRTGTGWTTVLDTFTVEIANPAI